MKFLLCHRVTAEQLDRASSNFICEVIARLPSLFRPIYKTPSKVRLGINAPGDCLLRRSFRNIPQSSLPPVDIQL
jgi:hypothetical protein